jgi:hypothetical protein
MKLRDNKQTLFSKETSIFKLPQKMRRPAVLLLAFSVIGAVIVLVSLAATNSISIEPENGSTSDNACKISDPTASNTSSIRFSQQPCQIYHDIFVSPSGNDSRTGTTEAQAVKTLTKAVALAADFSRIRLMAGTYLEQVTIKKNNLIIEPYGNGDVEINGAIPEFVNGVSGWTPVQSGIYKYVLTRNEYQSDGGNVIYDSNGQQQWTYSNYAQLLNRQTVNKLPGVFLLNNLFGVSEVNVATDTGHAPTAPLYIGGANPTIYINGASNISINSAGNSKLKLMYGSHNIFAKNSNDIKINSVEITGGKDAIDIYDTSNVSIKNNQLHGTFSPQWDWADVKEGNTYNTMENQAIQIKSLTKDNSNIVVDGNDMSGYFNGVNFDAISPYFIDNSVISNNKIHDSNDDGIEVDAQYRNLAINGNLVYDVYSPFSSTSYNGTAGGPIDVFENVFVANRVVSDDHGATTAGPSFALKMNDYATVPVSKNIHFYYNTFYFSGTNVGPTGMGGGNGRLTVDTNPGKEVKDESFINNIFYSYDGGIVRGSGRVADNIQWDGNVFYSAKNYPDNSWADNYWAWNSYYSSDNDFNNYPTLSSIISAGAMPTQWQGNVEGNPGFNCVDRFDGSCFRASASITKPSSKQPIPSGFTDSSRLNSRTRLGAFEQ